MLACLLLCFCSAEDQIQGLAELGRFCTTELLLSPVNFSLNTRSLAIVHELIASSFYSTAENLHNSCLLVGSWFSTGREVILALNYYVTFIIRYYLFPQLEHKHFGDRGVKT